MDPLGRIDADTPKSLMLASLAFDFVLGEFNGLNAKKDSLAATYGDGFGKGPYHKRAKFDHYARHCGN